MAKSANHHYIPKAILRHFCYSRETLHYHTKRRLKKGIEPRNIDTVFCKRNLNSRMFKPGIKDTGLEDFFAEEFDNHIPRFIDHLSTYFDTKPDYMDFDTTGRFIQFFYNHLCRSPEFHQKITDSITSPEFTSKSIKELEAENGAVSQVEKDALFESEYMRDLENHARIYGLARQSTKILDIMANMQIIPAKPLRTNKQFIISSNPIVRLFNTPDATLVEGSLELWTTLTPKLAVGLVNEKRSDKFFILDDRNMRHLNKALFNQSIASASKSNRLLASLVNSR